jgi:subtilisin family serine protease
MTGRFCLRVFAFLMFPLFVAWAIISFYEGSAVAAPEQYAAKVKSPGAHARLLSKIQSRGSARILVRINSPFSPEPLLHERGANEQRAAISRMQDRLLSELAATGKKPLKAYKYTYIPYMAMTVDSAVLDSLFASETVTGVYEDKTARPKLDKSVPRVGATKLHSAGLTGSGVAVAVLDTGVDKLHPFLKGSVVSEACYSSTDKSHKATSLCPKKVEESTEAGSAMPYGGVCPREHCGHGTHVAGIIAGRSGVSKSPGPGVAPGAGIIAIQVFSRVDSKEDCDDNETSCILSYDSDQIRGLERVHALRNTYTIAAANMSLGGGEYSKNCDDEPIKSIIDTLRAAGIATIAATGNEDYCGFTGAPACVSTAISIGATDEDDAVADYSNSATFMTLLAPGSEITSAVPRQDGAYESWNGTSMATPHAAGAWALLKQAKPTATVDEILNAFTSTGLNVTDTGKCASVTKKRITVYEAYQTLGGKRVLTVKKSGKGSGRVTASPPGIDCGDQCSASYDAGTTITLTAVPESESILSGWSGGGCSGAGTCSLIMNGSTTVTALFTDPCTYIISPEEKAFPSKGGRATIKVKATGEGNCASPEVSVSDSWITATLSSFKKNTGFVDVFTYYNDNPEPRTGTVTIADETLTIEQAETTCKIGSLDPPVESFEGAEDSGSFIVDAETDCEWTAQVDPPADGWITITSGSTGSGNRKVSFNVSQNDTDKRRTGKVTVFLTHAPTKKKIFTVKQDP